MNYFEPNNTVWTVFFSTGDSIFQENDIKKWSQRQILLQKPKRLTSSQLK